MRRFLLVGFYLCVVAVFAQLIAPAAMTMERAADPFGVICTHAPADAGDPPSHTGHPDHQHCVLCHIYLGGPTLDGRPTFTTFDFPVASPLRWALADHGGRYEHARNTAQPRGPPPSSDISGLSRVGA